MPEMKDILVTVLWNLACLVGKVLAVVLIVGIPLWIPMLAAALR